MCRFAINNRQWNDSILQKQQYSHRHIEMLITHRQTQYCHWDYMNRCVFSLSFKWNCIASSEFHESIFNRSKIGFIKTCKQNFSTRIFDV